jgi:hypothetical protein
VARDLPELFRRLVFNLLIDNTDDHVKNHGVLHAGGNLYELVARLRHGAATHQPGLHGHGHQ